MSIRVLYFAWVRERTGIGEEEIELPPQVRTVGDLIGWLNEIINADPESFRGLLLKKIRVPKNIQQTYRIPPFPLREVPTADQWADVMNWMVSKGLLKTPLPYKKSITSDYLP